MVRRKKEGGRSLRETSEGDVKEEMREAVKLIFVS